ncbi:hypothetical protein GUJ93_ZPchr0006g44389 [Zizania palustris]|uniref:VQ domain-containing protein n=1 Tax=Zizania palustris TaxID=103762 RepID=A0A8J5T6R3_ZIZPA|nr:hypothetical protein GUJ93_ZPchr0006g44389 [Zizania palustris]
MASGPNGGCGESALPGGGARRQKKEVKVTHIVTRKVSTDEASFKDVVQRLTGKDSAAARAAAVADAGEGSRWSNDVVLGPGGGGGGAGVGRNAVLFRDAATGGVLPSSEEMTRWWRGP